MGKTKKIIDKYIRVDFQDPSNINDPEEICRQIERHVDIWDGSAYRRERGRHAYLVEVTEDVCEYCGLEWEVVEEKGACLEEPAGLPLCCTKAQDEFEASPEGIEAQKKFVEASGITPAPAELIIAPSTATVEGIKG